MNNSERDVEIKALRADLQSLSWLVYILLYLATNRRVPRNDLAPIMVNADLNLEAASGHALALATGQADAEPPA